MGHLQEIKKSWANMTNTEKMDAIGILLVRVADHLPGGQVSKLATFNRIHQDEKEALKAENEFLRSELAKERKRSAMFKLIGDRYRNQIKTYFQVKSK